MSNNNSSNSNIQKKDYDSNKVSMNKQEDDQMKRIMELFIKQQQEEKDSEVDVQHVQYTNQSAEEIPEFFDDEDAFLPNVADALGQIFDEFDLNKDGVLDEQELQNFVRETNGDILDPVSLEEIKENFEIDREGNLTKRGFLEMYQLQTLSEPEETWRDLQKHGFNRFFKRKSSTTLSSISISSQKNTSSPLPYEVNLTEE